MAVQSRTMSLVEAVSNVGIGFLVALAVQITVFPWFGLHPSLGDNLAIGFLFTALSVVRSFLLRRLFEAIRRRTGTPAAAP